jgi:hypothetical protein
VSPTPPAVRSDLSNKCDNLGIFKYAVWRSIGFYFYRLVVRIIYAGGVNTIPATVMASTPIQQLISLLVMIFIIVVGFYIARGLYRVFRIGKAKKAELTY